METNHKNARISETSEIFLGTKLFGWTTVDELFDLIDMPLGTYLFHTFLLE